MTKLRVLGAILAVAGVSVCAEGAHATPATQTITLTATVPPICTINGGASATTAVATTIPILTTTDLPDTSTAITVGGLGAVVCNENTQLTLTSTNGGLTGPASVTGFDNFINYTATATYGTFPGTGMQQTLTTAHNPGATSGASGASTVVTQTATQSFGVTILPIAGNPLVGSSTNYTDTLVVTFTPHT